MKNKKPSFTIMELLIVVVIIGVLCTIAVPQFGNANIKNKQKEAKTYLQQMFQAGQMRKVEDPNAFGGGECPADAVEVPTFLAMASFNSANWHPKVGDGDMCMGNPAFEKVSVANSGNSWIIGYNGTAYTCTGSTKQCRGM